MSIFFGAGRKAADARAPVHPPRAAIRVLDAVDAQNDRPARSRRPPAHLRDYELAKPKTPSHARRVAYIQPFNEPTDYRTPTDQERGLYSELPDVTHRKLKRVVESMKESTDSYEKAIRILQSHGLVKHGDSEIDFDLVDDDIANELVTEIFGDEEESEEDYAAELQSAKAAEAEAAAIEAAERKAANAEDAAAAKAAEAAAAEAAAAARDAAEAEAEAAARVAAEAEAAAREAAEAEAAAREAAKREAAAREAARAARNAALAEVLEAGASDGSRVPVDLAPRDAGKIHKVHPSVTETPREKPRWLKPVGGLNESQIAALERAWEKLSNTDKRKLNTWMPQYDRSTLIKKRFDKFMTYQGSDLETEAVKTLDVSKAHEWRTDEHVKKGEEIERRSAENAQRQIEAGRRNEEEKMRHMEMMRMAREAR